MREELADYPRRTYEEYCGWVENGGGDEYFQPSEPDPAYVEAQAKQRVAYLCTETVMPLEVSLYDRIVPLALASLRSAAISKNGGLGEDIQRCRSTGCTCAQDRREAQQFADHI